MTLYQPILRDKVVISPQGTDTVSSNETKVYLPTGGCFLAHTATKGGLMANAHPSNEALLAAVRIACKKEGRELDRRAIAISPYEDGFLVELKDLHTENPFHLDTENASWAQDLNEIPLAIHRLAEEADDKITNVPVLRLLKPTDEELENARIWAPYDVKRKVADLSAGQKFWLVQT